MTNMIYIVSGASRSGKSIIAKKMLEDYQIPYMPIDVVMMGFMNGVKESGIHDKMWPNEIAKKLWGFLEGCIETLIHQDSDYLLEGEAFLPSLIQELIKKYPNKIKVVFIGYSHVTLDKKVKDVKTYPSGKNDWLKQLEDEAIIIHVKNMIDYSLRIKNDCEQYHLPYFDITSNFHSSINQVVSFLIK